MENNNTNKIKSLNSTMVRFIPVFLPQEEAVKAAVSIPLWFDSYEFNARRKRMGQRIGLNSTMVRFILTIVCMIEILYLVSIPLWFDSY